MADWIADFMRMSGKSVTASTSMTPQAWLAESPCSARPSDLRTALRAPSQPTTKPSLHGFHLPFVRGIEPFEPDGHRVGRRAVLAVRFAVDG